PGTYLAAHWNAAMSSFLESTDATTTTTVAPTTTTTMPTTTTTSTTITVPPPTSTTTTFSGSFNKKIQSKSFALTTRSGILSATLTFSKATSLSVQLIAANGTTVAQTSGLTPLNMSASVTGGTYTMVVSGSSSATFTLTVTYPSP